MVCFGAMNLPEFLVSTNDRIGSVTDNLHALTFLSVSMVTYRLSQQSKAVIQSLKISYYNLLILVTFTHWL